MQSVCFIYLSVSYFRENCSYFVERYQVAHICICNTFTDNKLHMFSTMSAFALCL